ncbi:glycoside hydrolase [Coprinopsis sp. MPI-PUGE-AT-0042]|nr:glycoside hydrolase [Coprinopsis sp. MPI-PUGE-AT-0042]
MKLQVALFASLAAVASAHFTFPSLVVDGETTPAWKYVRKTNKAETRGPIFDVKSEEFRCDDVAGDTTETLTVSVDSSFGIGSDTGINHPSVTNVYMAKAPAGVDVAEWDGSGEVWFKVHEVPAIVNDGSISFPSNGLKKIEFDLPSSLPSGQYLVRVENIALHNAGAFGQAQFTLSCAQIEVTDGGSGTPGPLVAFPGAYTGNESGILVNIYENPIESYTMPGPEVWQG